ncbi:MAG: 5'/3'-nucleotidase SurE [Acidobacteriia bacterium]|nr:5'/3'-nucleotidase SurE [Terriglobia bacterium]
MKKYGRTLLLVLSALWCATSLSAQAPSARFTILLSNDDGYDAPGLKALITALQPVGEIIVAAPATEQSGIGHALILRAPIMVNERKQPNGTVWYAIEGPPATCVRLALESLSTHRPDLVISGINRGDNLGTTVYHAGTLGAAREAALVGVPAIAVSLRGDDQKDYAAAAAYIRQAVEELRTARLLKPGFFLNVNFPGGEWKGLRITRLSMTPRPESFERRVSPGGRLYFWPVWEQLKDDDEGTDVWALVRGYITLTPMVLDVTATQAMEALKRLDLQPAATSAVE